MQAYCSSVVSQLRRALFGDLQDSPNVESILLIQKQTSEMEYQQLRDLMNLFFT